MKIRIKNFFKKKFVKNVMIIATGAAGAQMIGMLLAPIVTRLYGPTAFGVMGSFSAIISIIGPIVALTYPVAIVLPKSNRDAFNIIRISFFITVTITTVLFIVIIIFNQKIIDVFNLTINSNYLYWVPLAVFFTGVSQIINQWLIRTKQFSVNAKVSIYQSLITNLGKIGVGLIYPVANVLIVFTAISDAIKSSLMYMFSNKKVFNKELKQPTNKNELESIAKFYYDFPVYRTPEVFFNSLSHGLPVLLLTSFFGPASAGFYTIGRTVLTIPGRLIGNAVGDVFYPRIAEAANNKEDLVSLIKKATIVLAGTSVIPFGLIILLGPSLFSFVFGNEWATAGEYARWLALWAAFSFIASPSMRSLAVLKAQRFHLIYTTVTMTLRLSGILIGYFVYSNDIVSVALFGVFSAISHIFLIFASINISGKFYLKDTV